ncbi:MAG TPA: hypothetical protein PK129_08320 [Cellvibrionaceae bacterium]|nr:hypothetical protein [Cellvibrionaceae bacterium]
MNLKYRIISFVLVSLTVTANANEEANPYLAVTSGSMTSYTKKFSSECDLNARFAANSVGVSDVGVRGSCPLGHPLTNDMDFFSTELLLMLEHFGKIEEFKKTKELRISIRQKQVNPILVWAINDRDDWPKNIFQAMQTKYPSNQKGEMTKQARKEYRDMLRGALDSRDGFGKLYPHLAKIGCVAKVGEWFSDPLNSNLKDGFVTAEEVVKSGVATKNQLKKDIYPVTYFTEIHFDMNCTP